MSEDDRRVPVPHVAPYVSAPPPPPSQYSESPLQSLSGDQASSALPPPHEFPEAPPIPPYYVPDAGMGGERVVTAPREWEELIFQDYEVKIVDWIRQGSDLFVKHAKYVVPINILIEILLFIAVYVLGPIALASGPSNGDDGEDGVDPESEESSIDGSTKPDSSGGFLSSFSFSGLFLGLSMLIGLAYLNGGMMLYFFKTQSRGVMESPPYRAFSEVKRAILRLIIVEVLKHIIVQVGYMMLVLPGLYFQLFLDFAPALVLNYPSKSIFSCMLTSIRQLNKQFIWYVLYCIALFLVTIAVFFIPIILYFMAPSALWVPIMFLFFLGVLLPLLHAIRVVAYCDIFGLQTSEWFMRDEVEAGYGLVGLNPGSEDGDTDLEDGM
eukprot:TRINITY_DN1041_c1_g1_i1.p1 TRINITY_DN1041_c1_g1~~TRINITY_DN1041_c1_g1_i1.p1  ORF type:complete len:381 (+),score=98.75 TRINITY_DN1041_c1_g1_i1:81-1223(+)